MLFPHTSSKCVRVLLLLAMGMVGAACAEDDSGAGPSSPSGDIDDEPAKKDAGARDAGRASADAGRARADASSPTPVGSKSDAGKTPSGDGCALGEAGTFATDQTLDLFGETVYFAGGQVLPAGRYRVEYVDGCMKFSALWTWTVNQNVSGQDDGWWLVGASNSDRVALLPGTANTFIVGGYQSFQECVDANKQLPAQELDFAGGKLGIWLNDAPYTDNLAGESGNNPKWKLTLLVEECPPDLVLL